MRTQAVTHPLKRPTHPLPHTHRIPCQLFVCRTRPLGLSRGAVESDQESELQLLEHGAGQAPQQGATADAQRAGFRPLSHPLPPAIPGGRYVGAAVPPAVEQAEGHEFSGVQ